MIANDTGPRGRAEVPNPVEAPELYESILTRRVIAYLLDVAILLGFICGMALLTLVGGLLTAGLGLIALPFVVIGTVVGYYAMTLGTAHRATIGMRAMDIVLTPVRNAPLDGWRAFAHPMLFWLTCWILPPVSYLVALFTPRRQMLHDLILGVLMLRRSPMERFAREYAGGFADAD